MLLKICGMTRQQDLDLADELGFDFCGFIFHPKSPRYIAPGRAASLVTRRAARVGVFVEQSGQEIVEIMRAARLDYAQLHGSQTPADAEFVGANRVIRVLWPGRYSCQEELRAEAKRHDCFCYLLDAGLSGGGSGLKLQLTGLAGLDLPAPWLLAGGIGPDDINKALSVCQPDGFDFNSALEDTAGIKNHDKMRAVRDRIGK